MGDIGEDELYEIHRNTPDRNARFRKVCGGAGGACEAHGSYYLMPREAASLPPVTPATTATTAAEEHEAEGRKTTPKEEKKTKNETKRKTTSAKKKKIKTGNEDEL